MQYTFGKTPLSAAIDRVGKKALICLMCYAFFIILWGLRLTSLGAGTALSVCLLLALKKGERQRFKRRQKKLREQLGGALALDRLILEDPMRAHFEVAALLGDVYGFSLKKTCDAGIVCQIKGEDVLVALSQRAQNEPLSAQEVLHFQRAIVRAHCIRGVLAQSAPVKEPAASQSRLHPHVTLLEKKALLEHLGQAHPATDAQIIALSKMRSGREGARITLQKILTRSRAPRYALYGSLLLALYVITGLPYYPVPGLIMVFMAALSRIELPQKEGI